MPSVQRTAHPKSMPPLENEMKVSYVALNQQEKKCIDERLRVRLNRFIAATDVKVSCTAGNVLIVGDRPGPSAPLDPEYHHTPFYSTKHCSGWLNAALHLANIPEDRLVWINSADRNGNSTDTSIIKRVKPDIIICLGGNAVKWVKGAINASGKFCEFYKFDHPQFHKRFKNSEEYPLLAFLCSYFSVKDLNRL